MNLSDAQEFCRQYTRQHYENFTVASFLLPRQVKQAFYPVYSFCRWADDLGDESPDNQTALAALDKKQRGKLAELKKILAKTFDKILRENYEKIMEKKKSRNKKKKAKKNKMR